MYMYISIIRALEVHFKKFIVDASIEDQFEVS